MYSIAAAMAAEWLVLDGADVGDAADGPDEAGMPRDTFACAVVLVVELPYAQASVRRTSGWNGEDDARSCKGPLRTACRPL